MRIVITVTWAQIFIPKNKFWSKQNLNSRSFYLWKIVNICLSKPCSSYCKMLWYWYLFLIPSICQNLPTPCQSILPQTIKVNISIIVFDLFLHFRITPKSKFHLTCSYTYLELFLRGNQCTWPKMSSYYSLNGNGWNLLMEIVIYND